MLSINVQVSIRPTLNYSGNSLTQISKGLKFRICYHNFCVMQQSYIVLNFILLLKEYCVLLGILLYHIRLRVNELPL